MDKAQKTRIPINSGGQAFQLLPYFVLSLFFAVFGDVFPGMNLRMSAVSSKKAGFAAGHLCYTSNNTM